MNLFPLARTHNKVARKSVLRSSRRYYTATGSLRNVYERETTHAKARKLAQVWPLYDAMVTACRWRLERGRITHGEIEKILQK